MSLNVLKHDFLSGIFLLLLCRPSTLCMILVANNQKEQSIDNYQFKIYYDPKSGFGFIYLTNVF